jgi:hypothetical protein
MARWKRPRERFARLVHAFPMVLCCARRSAETIVLAAVATVLPWTGISSSKSPSVRRVRMDDRRGHAHGCGGEVMERSKAREQGESAPETCLKPRQSRPGGAEGALPKLAWFPHSESMRLS